MAAENPGSLRNFTETHTEIPEDEVVNMYSKELTAFRAEVTEPVSSAGITPEVLVLQKTLTKTSVERTQN